MDKSNHQRIKEHLRHDSIQFLFVFLAVLVLFILLYFLFVRPLWMFDSEITGQFGDSFGVITSFFTALAFAGLVFTILLQQKELRETRQEFKKQARILNYQRFDSTFFHLLRLQNEIINSFADGRKTLGRLQQTVGYEMNKSHVIGTLSRNPGLLINTWTEIVCREAYITQFFENLNEIIKLIFNSKKLDTSRKKYLSILIAQLSIDEKKLLICFFCLRRYHVDNFSLFKRQMFGDMKTFLDASREAYLLEIGQSHSLFDE
jgi:hypothetical protein